MHGDPVLGRGKTRQFHFAFDSAFSDQNDRIILVILIGPLNATALQLSMQIFNCDLATFGILFQSGSPMIEWSDAGDVSGFRHMGAQGGLVWRLPRWCAPGQ